MKKAKRARKAETPKQPSLHLRSLRAAILSRPSIMEIKTLKLTIFYSWQSDLPNNSNRSFIETALERAVKGILTDSQMEIAPVLDRDTKGIPGSPEIASTIFQKISNSHIFVGDITIINHRAKKPTPNPNVLIELGYALHVLGDAKIILIQNTAFGRPDLLPFDLKMKRVTTYSLNKNGQNKSEERKILIKKIEANLRSIYNIHFKPEEISKAKTAANISEELLHDLEFSDYKDNFISSVDGVRAAQSEYVNLIESVKDVISKTQNERIKFQIINTNDHRSFAINSLNLQLKIYWFCLNS